MANEAFADSPNSARAAQPSEADYAAISEALMETTRGRWFLAEFARRHRNADTRLVLDKVARLEESLAAQQRVDAAPDATAAIAEAVAAIRDVVEAAQVSASEALDALAVDHKLASVRRSARILREISWRLREIGNDTRICDLIDSQVAMIETSVAHMSADEARRTVQMAFASIAERLAAFSEDGGALQAAADAHDEAVLDVIAMEMGAPQPIEDDEFAGTIVDEASAGGPPPTASETARTILPNGPAKPPASIADDPLAPIRRMSQAEKIAFFS